MGVRERARFSKNSILLAAASVILSGCLMGEPTDDPGEALGMESELTGSVGDGPIVNASMRVLTADGAILSEFESDASAGYTIKIRANNNDYPLIVDAWNGTDLVTGLSPDFALRGAGVKPGSRLTANVNPYSTLAVELALDLDGGLTTGNIETAQAIVTSAANGGMTTLLADGPMFTPIDEGNIAEIVRATESLSEIVRRTRNWQVAFGFSTNADLVMEALGSDLVDQVIDGVGGSRTSARTAALSTVVGAQVLLETVSNELHVNGSNATAAMESAIQQVSSGAVTRELSDLTVTAEMLDQVRTGLTAAAVVSPDPALTQLRTALAGIQPGMGPTLIKSLLPANYRQTLENIMPLVAGADDATLEAINDVARSGGSDPQVNRAPTITGTPAPQIAAGTAYRFAPSASDLDGDTLTFSITGMPAWLSFSQASGVLSGTPSSANAGSYNNIVVRVSDGQVTASLPAFSITVTVPAVNSPPAISGTPATSVMVGAAYSFTPNAFDADGNALTFTISGRPGWASFNTQSGALTGTPGAAGTFSNIIIRVSDGQATTSLPAFSIAVTAPPVIPPANTPPTISGTPTPQVNVGQAYAFTPTAFDANGNALTFSITGRPTWLSFSISTGRLSGTPASADAGIHGGIVISVSDGQASASLAAFSITVVTPNRPPTISGTPPGTVNANTLYSFTPIASDPDGNALGFTVSGLPVWATFNTSTGRISGTPSAANVGNYTGIRITVSDGTLSAVLGPFSIAVQAVSLGSVTLSWTAPTQNEDGTPLTDLAGYKFYWGTSPGNYPNSVTVNNPGITTYVVENLAPGSYEFVAKSYNTVGTESQFSNPATRTVP